MDGYGPIDAALARLGGGGGDYGGFDGGGGATMGLRPDTFGSMGLRPDTFGSMGLTPGWNQGVSAPPGQTPTGQGEGYNQGAGYSGGGAATAVGGNWAALDAHNAEINAVATQYGLPANLLKSMINRESSGNWERDGYRSVDPDGFGELVPFVGVRRAAAESVGINYDQMIGNKQLQIEAMARILARDYQAYGSWEAAASNYLTGDPNAWQTGGTDSAGMRADDYVSKAIEGWQYLDGFSGQSGSGLVGGGWGGNSQVGPSEVVSAATSYAGRAAYVWGSVPGASQDPAVTGWDCSGMISWLNSKYAPNSGLPAGSHYQYQWAQQSGNLFHDTRQLRPGDIVFFDTGWRSGGGAYLNGASHVGMYIGNGKMVHAANGNDGTIISDFANYGGYPFLGAAHMPWSGGGAYTGAGGGTGGSPQYTAQQPAPMSQWQIFSTLLGGGRPPGY